MRRWAVIAVVVAIAPAVAAEPLVSLSGRVTDPRTAAPIEGAVVYIAGEGDFRKTRTTDAAGAYAVDLPPGTYHVTFLSTKVRSQAQVTLEEGKPATLDATLAVAAGEVIEIVGTTRAKNAPKPKNHAWTRVPRYSDEAILGDRWTRAWLMLSIDATGTVTKVKFLKRPGYNLEDIATEEAFRLTFEPGKDADGKAIRSNVIWSIDWPANSWMMGKYEYQRQPFLGDDDFVPCADTGPINITSKIYRGYRDCAGPDLSKAADEPWIMRPEE